MNFELSQLALNKSLVQIALAMLARREHSRQQVKIKLITKGFESAEIEPVLDYCESKSYLDDCRYGEMLVRAHIEKGHGLLRIKQVLIQKGLSQEHIQQVLDCTDCDWFELAKTKAIKKYGSNTLDAKDYKEKAKRVRYLVGQGFDYEQVNYALEESGFNSDFSEHLPEII